MTVAGTAAATAVDCAIPGLKTRIVSGAGTDEMGDFLVSKMAAYGVDTGLMRRDPSVQTSASMLFISEDGGRPAAHVPGSAATFCVAPGDHEAAHDARIVHVGGTGLLMAFDGAPTLEFFQSAKACGRTTTFDLIQANPETVALVEPLLPHIDYFIPSIDEASAMAGRTAPADVTRYFKERGVKNAILTLEGDGVYVDPAEGEPFHLPAHQIDVVDTTGCGDSFTAGVIAGLIQGRELRACVRFANAVAANVAMSLGSVGQLSSMEATLDTMNTWPLRS